MCMNNKQMVCIIINPRALFISGSSSIFGVMKYILYIYKTIIYSLIGRVVNLRSKLTITTVE